MEYYTGLLGVGDLIQGSAHRCVLPIVAVLSGGFERKLLSKAEYLFDSVEEFVRKIDSVDEYFRE